MPNAFVTHLSFIFPIGPLLTVPVINCLFTTVVDLAQTPGSRAGLQFSYKHTFWYPYLPACTQLFVPFVLQAVIASCVIN